MTTYRVKSRVFCAGKVYEPGELCDESVARALGSDAEPVESVEESGTAKGEAPAESRMTKPVKKASVK